MFFCEACVSSAAFRRNYAITLQSEGKVIIGGQFASINGKPRANLARLKANGSLDASFQNGTGGVSGLPVLYPGTSVNAVSLQSNGTLFNDGALTTVNGTNCRRVARLDSDGNLEGSFNPGSGVDSAVSSLVVQPDGKVREAGRAEISGG